MEQDFLPVVVPYREWMKNGVAYNINADEAASSIATALKAEKLAYLSDVEGVRTRSGGSGIRDIRTLYVDEAQELMEEGVISGRHAAEDPKTA